MADNQHNSPDLPGRHYFPESIDKTVEFVELATEPGYYGITIRFKDKTALTFVVEPCVFTFPVYEDWTEGEAKILKQYPPIRSDVEET
jgi:hypothetical protein